MGTNADSFQPALVAGLVQRCPCVGTLAAGHPHCHRQHQLSTILRTLTPLCRIRRSTAVTGDEYRYFTAFIHYFWLSGHVAAFRHRGLTRQFLYHVLFRAFDGIQNWTA